MRPVILSIAGSDSSGGAGIQADLKTIEACGGYGATAITAITAQNTREVRAVFPLSPDAVVAQIRAVCDDLPVAAIKTGMLFDAAIARAVASEIARSGIDRVVCDPVMISTSGSRLLDDAAIDVLLDDVFPLATVVTPNLDELCVLSGERVGDLEAAAEAARGLVRRGARAVLVTGGHWTRGRATDLLVTDRGSVAIEATALEKSDTHGSGCVLAAALATELARGEALESAVRRAKAFVTDAIARGLRLGGGPGPVDPTGAARRPR